MKPKLLHQEAMNFSFKAKEAFDSGDEDKAFEFYGEAAKNESEAATFYFDKPDLEPTRSLLIRSAAFLNLKAGLIEEAQRFIYFGLLHLKDDVTQSELNNALEISMSLKSIDSKIASTNFEYLRLLRLKSTHYILEPSQPKFGSAVTLEMIKDFSESYIKSLRAYSVAAFRRLQNIKDMTKEVVKQIEELIDPLVTQSSFGSFKFSIANNFLGREGESPTIINLKSNVINQYHETIFTQTLTDDFISFIKKEYDEDEINEIFRPLLKIKSNTTTYRVGYYNKDKLQKEYIKRVINAQRKKILPVKEVTQEEIGYLENSIIHTKASQSGKKSRKTIIKEQLKYYEFDLGIKTLDPKDRNPIMLNEEILISVFFDSNEGFTFMFDDLNAVVVDINYEHGLRSLHNSIFNKIMLLKTSGRTKESELNEWEVVKRLINNPDAIN